MSAGCGSTKARDDAAPRFDARVTDANTAIDAGPASAPPGNELTSGAGRVQGGTMTLDVEIGHGIEQRPATGGTQQVEGDTAIKP